MPESIEALEKIGLTKSEAKVYVALLELGSATTGPIVDKSGASSSKIYEILERLIKKGLVSFVIKGKTKYFEASPPERLIDYVDKKEKSIEMQKRELEKIMPLLVSKKHYGGKGSDAKIYKGFGGIKTALYDALNQMQKGEEVYVYGAPKRSDKTDRFFLKWNNYRAERGIFLKIMFNESARGQPRTVQKNSPLSHIRFMSSGMITPASVEVYKNRVLIFPEIKKEPLVVEINNEEVANSFKTHFDVLWNQQTHVYTGLEGPKLVLKDILETGKECLAMGIEEENFKTKIPAELKEFVTAMDKKQIKERLICKKNDIPIRQKYMKARFLSEEFFSPLTIEIYGNNVALIDWTHPITTIFIEKKSVAGGYRRYFETMWKIAKPN